VVILGTILEQAGGLVIETEGERALAPVLSCFDPPFITQYWVTPRRRVDFYCPRCRYGYEYLGEVDHTCVAQRLAEDERDAELRREGIRLGYVTKHDLRDPLALVATIAGSLTVRAHELGVEPPVAARPAPRSDRSLGVGPGSGWRGRPDAVARPVRWAHAQEPWSRGQAGRPWRKARMAAFTGSGWVRLGACAAPSTTSMSRQSGNPSHSS
jgi:hypothetical protein